MIYLIKSPEARKLENGEYEFFFSLKIGYTDDENTDLMKNKRLSTYFTHHRTIELLSIIPKGTELQEKKLHYKFKNFRWDDSNEWYVYDQSIVNYFKTVTLDDLNKLPNPDIVFKGNRAKLRKSLRFIFGYVYSSQEEIDNIIVDLVNLFGNKLNEETAIKYLESHGKDFSRYYEVKNNLETGKFCDNDIINNEVSEFLKHYQEITIKKDRLKLLCDLSEVDETGEVINSVLNQLQDSDQVKSYYVNLGPERIKQLGYNITNMNRELGIIVFSPELLQNKIYSEFTEGEKRTLVDIKDKLKEIYLEINYKKNPKATDINEFFEARMYSGSEFVDGKRVRVRGYELLKRLK